MMPGSELLLDGLKILFGAAAGALITKRVKGTVKLITHWGHVSSFTVRAQNQPPFIINTHDIVIRNAGNKAARNVRVTHSTLPEQFNVFPAVPYSVEDLPGGSKDIVFPTLVPKQQIVIAYMYNSPLTAVQIHVGIRSDDGFATPVAMELSEKTSRWEWAVGYLLGFLGLAALIYLGWRFIDFMRRVIAAV